MPVAELVEAPPDDPYADAATAWSLQGTPTATALAATSTPTAATPTSAAATPPAEPVEAPCSSVEAPPAPLLTDGELDQLFAAPQRPRWKLGLGAVIVLALVVCAIVVLAIALQPRANAIPALAELGDESAAPDASVAVTPAEPTASAPATVLIHVAGAVKHPGVYELQAGDRVIDAIEAAGGVTEAADAEQLNFARPLVDGEQIYVPEPGEAPPAGASGDSVEGGSGGGSSGGLVNLNTASATELETLPRIGPAMSQRIIDYREQHGGFTSIDQLKDVAGIGDATFDGLKDLVTV